MADEITARQFLYGRTNKGKSSVDGMRGDFAVKLANMMSDPNAPPGLGIYSGYRSPQRQAEIIRDHAAKYGLDGNAWWSDVEAMGPIAAGKKWAGDFKASGMSAYIGKPGGSNHQHGDAADLSYNGQSLKHAPKEVVDWVHGNAERYGLKFPLANENWHIEDSSTRGGAPTGSDVALAAGGNNTADGAYVPMDNTRAVNPQSSWLDAASPDTTFQPTETNYTPTWGEVGGAALRTMPTSMYSTWASNREAAPDMNFLNNTNMDKFGTHLDGLNNDERDYIIKNAMSAAHVEVLRSQLDQQKADATTFDHSYAAMPAAFLANVVDPISLLAGGVIGKAVIGGSNALRAATTAGIAARMAEGGAIALGDTAVSSTIQAQVDPNFGVDDVIFNGLVGATIGLGAGALGRAADASPAFEEAAAFFGTKARNVLADNIEKRGYKMSQRTEQFLRPQDANTSAGAAFNPEGRASLSGDRRGVLEKVADSLTTFVSKDSLLRNNAGGDVAYLYKQLMPELSGTGGRELRASESAYEMMHRAVHTEAGQMEAAFQTNLDNFLEETGRKGTVSWFKRDEVEREFSMRVDAAMYDPATARGSKAVEAMADTYRKAFKDKLREAKATGAEWAKDVPEDDTYVPFVIDKHAYYTVVQKIGREGLIDVVRQAFVRAQPNLAKVEKKVTKKQWDAYNAAIKEGRTVEKPQAKPIREGTKAHARAALMTDKKLYRVAERYVEMIEATKIDNNNASRMVGLAGESERALRDILEGMSVPEDEINDFLTTFGYTQKAGPSNFRRRAVIERMEPFVPQQFSDRANKFDYAVSLRDLTARDIRTAYDRYSRSINGQLALLKKGFKSEAEARKAIEDATTFRKQVAFDANGKQNVFESDLLSAREELNYHLDRILGKPAHPGYGIKARLAINLMKSVNFIRFMQQSGIAQLGDAPKILLRYGVGATWSQRRFRDIIDVFKHNETEANALSREIQSSTGIGIKTTTGRLYATHEDINFESELFDENATATRLARLNAYAETGARLTATVSLINPITDTLQLWAARAASQRLVDLATGNTKNTFVGKLLGNADLNTKWMNELGITKVDLEEIRQIAQHMKLDEDGKILRWNSEKQRSVSRAHADAYDRFLGLVRREVNQVILEPSPNAIRKFFSSPTASLFMQLKTYMLNSLLVNTAKNIKMGPAFMAQSLIATSVWGGAVYAAQSYMQSFGRPDREKFLEDRLSLKSLLTTGFARSPDASIFPMIIDTTLQGASVVTGKDMRMFNNTRTSGLGSSIADSIPAVKTAEDAIRLLAGSVAAMSRKDQEFDQEEGRLLRDFIPFARTYGILNATNAIVGTLPENTDGAVIKDNNGK